MKTIHSEQEHEYLKQVGRRIREARQNLGLSQEQLSITCNLDRTYISDVERGIRNLSVLNLDKIAHGLEVHVSILLMP